MHNKKKPSIVSFESFAVSQIPQCKKPLSGIRAGSIKKRRRSLHQETSPKPFSNAYNFNEIPSKPTQSYLKSTIYRTKPRRPLSLSSESQSKPLQVAFYNFLPNLENNSYPISPKLKIKNVQQQVKENKYLHKYFDRVGKTVAESSFGKSITVNKVFRCNSSGRMNEESPGLVDNLTKAFVPRYDSPDEDEIIMKEYSHILKPKFNL